MKTSCKWILVVHEVSCNEKRPKPPPPPLKRPASITEKSRIPVRVLKASERSMNPWKCFGQYANGLAQNTMDVVVPGVHLDHHA